MQRLRKLYVLVLSFLLLLSLQACGSEASLPTSTPNPSATAGVSNKPVTTASVPTVPTSSLPNVPTTSAAPPVPNALSDWLIYKPCYPPCFQGMTPGLTTAEQALKLLQRNPQVATVKLIDNQYGAEVDWDWVRTSQTKRGQLAGGGRAFLKRGTSPPVIKLITFWSDNDAKLGDVLKAYGEPGYIGARFNRNEDLSLSYGVQLVYLAQGFTLFSSDYHKHKPVINNDLGFRSPEFFVPGMDGYKDAFPTEEYTYIVPWKGINSFDFYCQYQRRNGSEKCSDV